MMLLEQWLIVIRVVVDNDQMIVNDGLIEDNM